LTTNYADALQYLYSFTDVEQVPGLAAAAAFDLAKVHYWFDLIGRPEDHFRSILVAGTKGKGSTASYIAGALRAAGYRVGLYTQPHLTTFRERLQIDGSILPAERLGPLVDKIRPLVKRMHRQAPQFGRLTTYEISTALALRYFAEEAVDYAVLEIGLGGRLDAVNAVRTPLVSAITSLSLDHTQVLGTTIAQIAREKAGIIKPATPVVSAPQPAAAQQVIEMVAAGHAAPLYQVGVDLRVEPDPEQEPGACSPDQYGRVRRATQAVNLILGPRLRTLEGAGIPTLPEIVSLVLPLLGQHQATNAAVAAAACLLLARSGAERLTLVAMQRGFRQVSWPGRLEVARQHPLVVLDGAHNGDSAAQLAAAVPDNFCYRQLILILGVSADKDIPAIVRPLLPLAHQVIFTRSHHPRAAAAGDVAAAAARLWQESPDHPAGAPPFGFAADAETALRDARAVAGPDDAILVTGSLFVVGEVRAALGLAPAVDEAHGDFFYRLDKTVR